jgi:hypothetical protein
VTNLPALPDEEHAAQYHDIIKLFEEVCGQDLSRFRIAPGQARSAGRGTMTLHGQWMTQHPNRHAVEAAYFHQQVRELIKYLQIDLGSHQH